jgi:hypothetical protein
MALPTNTFATYASIGNREDLADVIYNVDPTETPFLSSLDKVKATAVNHEWQTQALAAASGSNAVLEGNDAVTDAATPTVRLGNICQISDKVARVTGTQQAIDKAGRGDELDYQVILKGKELKRDMETILLQNQAKAAGDSVTARTLGSVLSYVATNDDLISAGASPTGTGVNTRTDAATPQAFTEARLKNVLQLIWTSGGNPDRIMLGGFNKQVMSSFVGRGTPTEDTKTKKIVATVDVYESDFGTLKVVANRFQRARDVHVHQSDMWAMAYLRNMKTEELAKTGDNRSKQIICEYTLEARNEKASGLVADCTSS